MPKKTTKKTTTVRKTTRVAPAPVMDAHACGCGDSCKCGCKCGKIKKLIVMLIVFLLGFAVAKFAFCPCHHHNMKMPHMHPVFVDGCLDMQSVKCPKMQETLAVADVDANGCITEEEFKDAKRAMRHHMRKMAD